MSGLGAFFESLRSRPRVWRNVFFAALVVLVGLNFVIRPEETHFGLDGLPGFFAAFGLVVGAAMLLVMGKIVRPLIARKDEFYGDI